MPERNLFIKFRLNKPLVSEPNASPKELRKGTMASTVAVTLANNNAFDKSVGEMMEHNPTFINVNNPHRF